MLDTMIDTGRGAFATLTRREQVVLEHLLEGLTLQQIAAVLYVSRNTVKTQTSSIYRKLDVASRAELLAAVLAADAGVGAGTLTTGTLTTGTAATGTMGTATTDGAATPV
ncbi:regulatory LuxR family protein [Sediminihabitans luteus]|uniref:Regulatory LuxR family protein n=2 Tax=Sediminihabitans luteus TaxID=1138585 RepID=A0A2M9CE76_9CELL|nr:regulatory LuxR family protein [Sediminihabitans luteus]